MLWSQMTFCARQFWKIAPPTSRSSPKTPPHLSVHFCSLPPTFQSTPNAYPSFGPILCFYFDVINKIQKLISTLILPHCRCVYLHIHIFCDIACSFWVDANLRSIWKIIYLYTLLSKEDVIPVTDLTPPFFLSKFYTSVHGSIGLIFNFYFVDFSYLFLTFKNNYKSRQNKN